MPGKKIDAKQFLKEFTEDPNLRLRLNMAGMKLALEEQQLELNRQEAEIVNLGERHQHELNAVKSFATSLTPAPTLSTSGVAFAEAVAEYLTKNTKLKANTKATYRSKLEHAQNHFGSTLDLRTISQAEFSQYAQKTALEVADPTTAANYIQTVAGFLNWFRIREGWGAAITTKTLLPKKTRPDTQDRDAFTLEQVTTLFKNAAKYRDNEPHKYWASILPAFMGCRIEELAQLNLETDLVHDANAGVWYFDLNENLDPDGILRKSLKNKASWRVIPIHSSLIDAGLLDYLKAQREAGFSRPFESGWAPRIHDDGKAFKWSQYIGKWGGRELKELIKQGKLPEGGLSYFHSQRHTFSQQMGDAGVPADVCEALMGHTHGDGERERYNKLKTNYALLSREGVEPGLIKLSQVLTQAGAT